MDVLHEIKDKILWITIDNQKSLNALSSALIQKIGNILEEFEDNALVKVAVLRGASTKAFAAGADINELKNLDGSQALELSAAGHRVFNYIESYRKPILAMMYGVALGGGFELALACHLRIATPSTLLGFPEIKLGLIPGYGGHYRMACLAGKERATRYILTGDYFTAQEAATWGLISFVFDEEELEEETTKLATKLSAFSPEAIRSVLYLLNLPSTHARLEEENKQFSDLFDTVNAKEGLTAFLEKRKAQFT